jgi:hypothetical protein
VHRAGAVDEAQRDHGVVETMADRAATGAGRQQPGHGHVGDPGQVGQRPAAGLELGAEPGGERGAPGAVVGIGTEAAAGLHRHLSAGFVEARRGVEVEHHLQRLVGARGHAGTGAQAGIGVDGRGHGVRGAAHAHLQAAAARVAHQRLDLGLAARVPVSALVR